MYLSFLAIPNKTNWGKRCKDYQKKKALDGLMPREFQFQFRKNGLKGKRTFSKTQHHKCLIGKSQFYKVLAFWLNFLLLLLLILLLLWLILLLSLLSLYFITIIIILKTCLSHRSVLRSPRSAVICIEIDKWPFFNTICSFSSDNACLMILTGKDWYFTQCITKLAAWLLLIFLMCLHNQLSSLNSTISTDVWKMWFIK